jgi:hypothetical protein
MTFLGCELEPLPIVAKGWKRITKNIGDLKK